MTLQKLYYAPGIISLLGYLFLLPYAYNKSTPKPPVRAIPFFALQFPVANNDHPYIFTTRWILKDVENKKKIKFFLNDDRADNQKKIELIRWEARRLKYTLDSSSVIFIEYTDDLLYGELFKILDNCNADKIRRYATWSNYFVIFGETPPKPKKNDDNFSDFFCCDIIRVKPTIPDKSLTDKIAGSARPFSVKQIGSMAALWLFLIITTLYYNKKRRK